MADGATRGPAGSARILRLAVFGNLCIAIAKFVAAAFTGSAAMASEAVHTLVDTCNEAMLLYGHHRSQAPPDREHPFGYGRELYFWSFMVALLIFTLGSGFSLWRGIDALREPEPLRAPLVNFVVLGVSVCLELISWIPAMRSLRRQRRSDATLLDTVRDSKDPATFTVFLEDSAAIIGLALAAIGIGLVVITGDPRWDAYASFAIAALLAATGVYLARETKALLIGERAHPHLAESVLRIAAKDPAIAHANGVLTAQMGPDRVIAALSAEFERDMDAAGIEACVTRLEEAIHAANPTVRAVFVKPQSREVWDERKRAVEGPGDPKLT